MPNRFGALQVLAAVISATTVTATSATTAKTPDEQHYLDKTAMAQRLELTADKHAWGSCLDVCASRGGTLATLRNAAEDEAAKEFLAGTGATPCV